MNNKDLIEVKEKVAAYLEGCAGDRPIKYSGLREAAAMLRHLAAELAALRSSHAAMVERLNKLQGIVDFHIARR